MQRTTIYIDEKLKKQVQKLCIDKGISMTQFIYEAMKEKLSRDKK